MACVVSAYNDEHSHLKHTHGLNVKVWEGEKVERGGRDREGREKRKIKAHHQDKYSDKSL